MKKDDFVLGVDFGTDSVRTILVNAHIGQELAASVFPYPRWKDGLYCNPSLHQFRQHPKDYLEGLEQGIRACLAQAGASAAACVRAISADTTGSSPVAVDKSGTPLSLVAGFEDNPNAMFVLWKDHSATREAASINEHARKFEPNYLQFVGGIYSSEWFWAKLLHVLRSDQAVRQACYSWVEHCDWIPFVLTGGTDIGQMRRSICAAGHKALWAEEFGGLPPDEFFSSLDPLLQGFTARLYTHTYTADQSAGCLSAAWAQRLGLSTQTRVGVGAFDAHMGAVGGQIKPYYLSKVMGTSTCDMLVAPKDEVKNKLVRGICGQVPGSILPNMIGMEAGQSAFGDAYAWFSNLLAWPLKNILNQAAGAINGALSPIIESLFSQLIPTLSKQAAELPLETNSELALDWLNGRRTPDANHLLRGAITGLNLASDAPRIFQSIVEATCFGAKAIVNRFQEEGIEVQGLIGLGGVARKSPFIMQMMADVINMPLLIHRSEQTCAMGAAMFAATTAGIHPNLQVAMDTMGQGFDAQYLPNPEKTDMFANRFDQYRKLGHFIEEQSG
jgi:L-ribulokinase